MSVVVRSVGRSTWRTSGNSKAASGSSTMITGARMSWKASGADYLPVIAAIEQTYGIPTDLLSRIAFEESGIQSIGCERQIRSGRYVPTAATVLPRCRDRAEDAQTAAKYLVVLHRQFDDDLQLAVAAYNWGPGESA